MSASQVIPDVERLRRFALAAGLLLLTYVAAGISLDTDLHVAPLGIPFRISRPELLPIALVLATLCGMLRFYYYAVMLADSPFRVRRDLLDSLVFFPSSPCLAKSPPMYWGPTELDSSPLTDDRSQVEQLAAKLQIAFPKFARARVKATVEAVPATDYKGEDYVTWGLKVVIPLRCRIAALLQDVDYTAPVWFNMLVLGIAAYRL